MDGHSASQLHIGSRSRTQRKGRERGNRSGSAKTVLLVFIAALVAGAAVVVLVLRDGTPFLDRATLEEREKRWLESPLTDYDLVLRIEIDGQEPESRGVQVRGGVLVAQTLNGEPQDKVTNSTETIGGLFDTMRREIALAEKPLANGSEGHTTLRAAFHEKLGFPTIFKRLTSRPGGRSVIIRVKSLDVPGQGTLYSDGAS